MYKKIAAIGTGLAYGLQVVALGGFLTLFNACSSDDGKKSNPISPVKPTPEKPLIHSVQGDSLTNKLDNSAKIDRDADCDSAIVGVDGVEQRLAFNPDSTIDYKLAPGDGEKDLEFKVISKEGILSEPDYKTVRLDQTAPVASNLILPSKTNSTSIDAIMSSLGADSVKFFGNVSDTSYKAYKDTMNLLLTGVGSNTVYSLLKDKAGNVSIDTLSGIVDVDTESPLVPTGFKDTTLYDNTVDLGNFDISGLSDHYFTLSGATSGNGPLDSLPNITYNQGTTDVAIFMNDGANVTKDTAKVVAMKLDSQNVLTELLNFYSSNGHVPDDSMTQQSGSDPINSVISVFDYSFPVSSSITHHVKVEDNVPDSILSAFNYTTSMGQDHGLENRYLILGKDFKTPFKNALQIFYDAHQ